MSKELIYGSDEVEKERKRVELLRFVKSLPGIGPGERIWPVPYVRLFPGQSESKPTPPRSLDPKFLPDITVTPGLR